MALNSEDFISSEMCVYHSMIKDDRYDYSGKILFNEKLGLFFYRGRNRIEEVIAGYSKGYSFGMEFHILEDLEKRNVEYIFIETQYNIWEIYLYEFLDKCIESAVKGLYVCDENYFLKHSKDLIGLKKSVNDVYLNTGRKVIYGSQSSLF